MSKFFKIFSKNNAGRNNRGRVTVFSKGRKLNKNITLSTKPIIWDDKMSVITSIFRTKKKLFTLNKHLNGSYSYKPYISGTWIGQNMFTSNLPKKYWSNNLPGNLVLLKNLNKHSLFSNIFIKNIRKYSLSNGTFCKIIDIFLEFNIFKIVLPSRNTKLVSGWSFIFLGKNSQHDYRYSVFGKAGVNIIQGKKSKVRGVARNPVDHPHGGRTKTNQPEVSIWGWVAKKNK